MQDDRFWKLCSTSFLSNIFQNSSVKNVANCYGVNSALMLIQCGIFHGTVVDTSYHAQ